MRKIIENIKKEISLDDKKQKELEEKLSSFVKLLKKNKIDFFIGGSIAKGTLIKKDNYDVDIFLRFKNEEEIKKKLEKTIRKIKGKFRVEKIHGSRDYYNIINKDIIFEIVPVVRLNNPKKAKNTTDLSYFHVSYVKNKIKRNKRLAEEIKLAKTFVFSSNCYGAESYISGFSGYAIELLVIYYKTFENFIRAIPKNKDKLIIDIEKDYKNKQEILDSINESKLISPIILVDPTFKERNVTSALSLETFEKFKDYCRKFLKKPDKIYFSQKEIKERRLKELNKKKPIKITITTNKQEGAIAGSKLLKFYKYLEGKIFKYYKINDKEFLYDEKKKADCYFVLKKRDSILIRGPPISKVINVIAFKDEHKKTFIKNKIIYAEEKKNISVKEILENSKKIMKEMGISGYKV
jgi:tRNA nucleotidyltransferase (CCA-adding enzyme)